MIDKLIRWSLQSRGLVLTIAAVLLVWGGWVALDLPVDVLPDLTAPTVTILVEAPGMAPTELEPLVTFPIETALNGAAGVRRVRSGTTVGTAVIWVEFEWGADIYRARQTVAEKLTLVTGTLPEGVEPPVLAPISSIMGEVLFLAIEPEDGDRIGARTFAETTLRRRLLAVPGVSQVVVIGGDRKQYQITLDPLRLRAQDVTLGEVERALRASNQNTSAGFHVSGGQEYLIVGIGRLEEIAEIGETVVRVRDGKPVFVRDLGEVAIGRAIKRGEGSFSGRPAVVVGIQKQPEANTLELTERLDGVLDEIEASAPSGLTVHRNVFRQADFIASAIGNLSRALRDGGILVVIVVILFLANGRAAGISLLAIPLSLVAAVLVMKAAGASLNSMTLGGMAIAIGALVDDAIIDVENVVRRLRENAGKPEEERRSKLNVVYEASREVRGSIVFATLIIGLVFMPLFFLSGVEGRLLRPLGLAYLVSLFASLLVALTVTPALCLLLLPGSRAVRAAREPRWITGLKGLYQRLLLLAFRFRPVVLGVSLLCLVLALASFPLMGRAFLPDFNEGTLTISVVTLPGTSLAESDKLGSTVERLLLEIPEIESTARRTGRAELDEHVQGVESAEIDVTLNMLERPKEEVLAQIRERLSLVPGTNVTIGQPISHRIDHMLSGRRANVAVKVFGPDLATLRSLAGRVEDAMRGVPGVVDLSTEQQANIPLLRAHFERSELARHGLPAGEAAAALRTSLFGLEVGSILENETSVPVVMRLPERIADDIDKLRDLPLDTPAGHRVSLANVAELRRDRGPNFISREHVRRMIAVTCNVAGRDLRSTVDEVREIVAAQVPLPTGYAIEYGGQFESEARASRALLGLGITVVVGILLLLTSAFRSVIDAVVIMLNLPLALLGGAAGVFLSGGVLSVASTIGFITLFGIASRNGIMLISHVRHLREEEGVNDVREAIVRGARERLVPILMTALATAFALVPLALGGHEAGNEIEAPMAVVILSGLITATALNMLVVPLVYDTVLRARARRRAS